MLAPTTGYSCSTRQRFFEWVFTSVLRNASLELFAGVCVWESPAMICPFLHGNISNPFGTESFINVQSLKSNLKMNCLYETSPDITALEEGVFLGAAKINLHNYKEIKEETTQYSLNCILQTRWKPFASICITTRPTFTKKDKANKFSTVSAKDFLFNNRLSS